MNQIYTCKLDNKECKSQSEFVVHLKKCHGFNTKSYYDSVIKPGLNGKCLNCTKDTIFLGLREGYQKSCSNKCRSEYFKNHKELQELRTQKIKKTKLEKYGDENYNNVDKMQKTCLKKYGKITATGTEEYNKKHRETCLKRYGVEHHAQSDEVKNKSKQTCLNHYGVEYTLQSKEIRDRIDNTVNEKYGGYTLASKTLSEKMKNTMIEKYGVENALQSDVIKEKQRATNRERYGASVPTQNKDVILKMKKSNIKKYGIENTFNLIQTKNTFLEKYNVINPSQIPAVQEKIKETCLEKYGSNTFFASDYAKEKIKNTCMERYGVSCVLLLPEIKEKSKQTNILKYGVAHPMQNSIIRNKVMSAINRKSYKLQQYMTIFNDNIVYQSLPELAFIKLCESRGLRILNGPVLPYILDEKNRMYYSDFLISDTKSQRIVEIKRKHEWWFSGLKSGEIKAKTKCAIKFSKENGYLPYKIIFENKI